MSNGFKTKDEFHSWCINWCYSSSIEKLAAFATQNAARALPNTLALSHSSYNGDKQTDSRNRLSSNPGLTTIRAILVGAIRTKHRTTKLRASAGFAAMTATEPARSAAQIASIFSHGAAADKALKGANEAIELIGSAGWKLSNESKAAAKAAYLSSAALDENSPSTIFGKPLWLEIQQPRSNLGAWQTARTEWLTSPAMAFWIDWYDGLLIGRTPDWGLWKEIALIRDEVWESGEEAVAEAIEALQAAQALEAQIERLKTELTQLAAATVYESNSHNGGPLLDDTASLLAIIQHLTAEIDALKAEVAKRHEDDNAPDPEVIESIMARIVAWARKHFIIATAAGVIASGCAVKITEDAIDHYHVSKTIFIAVDDVAAAAGRYVRALRAKPSQSTDQPKSKSTMDIPTIEL